MECTYLSTHAMQWAMQPPPPHLLQLLVQLGDLLQERLDCLAICAAFPWAMGTRMLGRTRHHGGGGWGTLCSRDFRNATCAAWPVQKSAERQYAVQSEQYLVGPSPPPPPLAPLHTHCLRYA